MPSATVARCRPCPTLAANRFRVRPGVQLWAVVVGLLALLLIQAIAGQQQVAIQQVPAPKQLANGLADGAPPAPGAQVNQRQALAAGRATNEHQTGALLAQLAQLGPVLVVQHQRQRQQPVEGPGVDLVALNERRFELDHHHGAGSLAALADELRRAELIESQMGAIPDRILAQIPGGELGGQLSEIVGSPPDGAAGLILVPAQIGAAQHQEPGDGASGAHEDPDEASIERLTKSCLTVHASSAPAEQLNVTFHLFTKQNPQLPFIMGPQIGRLELLNGSPFDARKPIKWITHGFHTNLDKSEWMLEAKEKILANEEANVILTDWRRGASPALAFYPKAAANAHIVAKMIVKILRRLRHDIDLARVHLIGHSLGAHIMGFVGSAFTEEYLNQEQQRLALAGQGLAQHWRELARPPPGGQLIGRITACDPALPCFGPSSSAPNRRLGQAGRRQVAAGARGSPGDQEPVSGSRESGAHGLLPVSDWTPAMWTHLRPDSAAVVEVMHSNPGVMGYADPLGDFDFYPNGFERQPGCGTGAGTPRAGGAPRARRQFSHTLDRFVRPIKDFFTRYTCSHHRSVEYMVESMYYEQVQQDRKLDRDLVCQMVGYRCSDYQSFKKGFCFRCRHEHDCRAFVMSVKSLPTSELGYTPSLGAQYYNGQTPAAPSKGGGGGRAQSASLARRGRPNEPEPNRANNKLKVMHNTIQFLSTIEHQEHHEQVAKRVLPTLNHYKQNYKPVHRNQYFFDTKPVRDYCLHHYHIFVKYRWFRVRESLAIERFKLIATLANISRTNEPSAFHKFTHHSYTMLMTHPIFLGQIESLIIFGDKLKSSLIEYVEVNYLSNLDARIRSLGSARLCRSTPKMAAPNQSIQLASLLDIDSVADANTAADPTTSPISLFVRCSGLMVRRK